MLARILLLLSALCLCLASSEVPNNIHTHPPDHITSTSTSTRHSPIDTPDPKCPEGYHNGFDITIWQFNVPLPKWLSKTGSFIHADWYGHITSTKGPDNTNGTTRTIHITDATFTERLMYFHRLADLEHLQFFVGDGDSYPVRSQGVEIGPYTQAFKGYSICGGEATLYVVTTAFCSDKVVAGYDLFSRRVRERVGKVAEGLGAKEFRGTCLRPGED